MKSSLYDDSYNFEDIALHRKRRIIWFPLTKTRHLDEWISWADWQHLQEWCWWWTGWYYRSEQSSVTDRLCRGTLSTKHAGGIQNTMGMTQRCTLRIMFTQQHISNSGNQVMIIYKGAHWKAWCQSAGLFVCMFMLISSCLLMALIL